MTPGKDHLNVKHRIRRAHPLRPLMDRSLRAMDHASPEELRAYQEHHLRRIVHVAARFSPYYRDFFRSARLDPRDIRTIDDLAQLPLLTKEELAEDPDRFRVYPAKAMWSSLTSGTSGRSLRVYRTPGSSVFELSVLERQWGWFGLPRSARRIILRGSDFAADGPPVKSVPGGHQLLISSYRLGEGDFDLIASEMRTFDADAVEGWPSSIAILATMFRDRGETLPVKAVITSSEVMNPGQRQLMRDVFTGPIVDHYGQTERVAMAGNCERGGYHIFDDYGIVELLPVDGAPDRGEIVGTSLHNWGFPLLRYRTGDEVGPARSEPCVCGRGFARLGDIDGRSEDTFVTAEGLPLPMPSSVVDDLTGLREAQIAQLAPGRFEVRVVPGHGFDADAFDTQVRRNIDRLFGSGHEVSVRTVTEVPRPASGKLKAAVVERSPVVVDGND